MGSPTLRDTTGSVVVAPASPRVATTLDDHLPYGQEGVLVESLDLEPSTGSLAARCAPELHREVGAE
jgi:hypothetical protein